MEKSYFKDIFFNLSNLYPNTKVYVVSDEHFFHNYIINYTRPSFYSIDDMNETIINEHNKIVGKDDIVIILGDFCFKNSQIANITSRLNGHKFIILGNHDDVKKYSNKYTKFGFENIYFYPIKYNDYILSHEPIADKINDPLMNLLRKEFNRNHNLTNLHGHEHICVPHERSKNVTVENLNYKPLYIGTTTNLTEKFKPSIILDSKDLNEIIEYLTRSKNLNRNVLIDDLIYSMMLESMQSYNDEIIFFGSYSIYKKTGIILPFSDLDGTFLYNQNKSKRTNANTLKQASESAYFALNSFDTCHPFYHKRMIGVYILGNYFTNGTCHDKTYLDLNMISKPIYKQSDYTKISKRSYFESQLEKYDKTLKKQYYFPKYEINVLNDSGDLANLLLQYLFQRQTTLQRKYLIKKIQIVSHNIDFNNFDVDAFEDQVIRFFLKNIYFFNLNNRNKEINLIFNHINNINELEYFIPKKLLNIMLYIVETSKFRVIYNKLQNSNNILKNCDEILIKQLKK